MQADSWPSEPPGKPTSWINNTAGGEEGGRGDRDGEDMWTQGLFISMYDKIHYKKKKKKT